MVEGHASHLIRRQESSRKCRCIRPPNEGVPLTTCPRTRRKSGLRQRDRGAGAIPLKAVHAANASFPLAKWLWVGADDVMPFWQTVPWWVARVWLG